MKRISKETFDCITLDASLQRLGVVELDERLEFSPLLVEGGLQEPTGETSSVCCVCKIPQDELGTMPDIHMGNPTLGDGSTGPTDGRLVW